MDQALQSIYECLKLSEEKFLEKKAHLRCVKDEKTREKSRQELLQTHINNSGIEIKRVEKDVYDLVAKKTVQTFICDVVEEKISICKEACRERRKIMEEQAICLNRQVERFVKDILDFHSALRLEADALEDPLNISKNKDGQQLLEENAVRCDLKIREDLLRECNTLEEELQKLTEKLEQVQENASETNKVILEEIKASLKLRNEITEPKSIPSIQMLEKNLNEVEQEAEFLKAACLALEKEREICKSTFSKHPKTTQRKRLSAPQIFKREEPASTPGKRLKF